MNDDQMPVVDWLRFVPGILVSALIWGMILFWWLL